MPNRARKRNASNQLDWTSNLGQATIRHWVSFDEYFRCCVVEQSSIDQCRLRRVWRFHVNQPWMFTRFAASRTRRHYTLNYAFISPNIARKQCFTRCMSCNSEKTECERWTPITLLIIFAHSTVYASETRWATCTEDIQENSHQTPIFHAFALHLLYYVRKKTVWIARFVAISILYIVEHRWCVLVNLLHIHLFFTYRFTFLRLMFVCSTNRI